MRGGGGLPGPWRPAERLLARCIPPESASGPSILGDLREDFARVHARSGGAAAHAWYLWQVLGIGGGYVWHRAASVGSDLLRGTVLDARGSFRRLMRTPALTVAAVLSLALGACLAMVAAGFASSMWLAPLPYPDADRLVIIGDTHATRVCPSCEPGTSWRSLQAWRASLDGLEGMEATRPGWVLLNGQGGPVDLRITAVTEGYFDLLGLEVAMGRGVGPGDTDPGAQPVAVLHPGLWESAWGSDPDVLGQTITLDGAEHVVVGVLSADAPTTSRTALYSSLTRPAGSGGHGDRGLQVVARLAPGTTPEALNAALEADAAVRYGEDPSLEPGWSARAVPLREALLESAVTGDAILVFLLLAVSILAVAALNLSALLLAQVTERRHELSLRAALGASRLRVARAGIMDALVLSAAGGLGALALAWNGGHVLLARYSAAVPGWMRFTLDLRIAALALAVIALTAVLAGAPSLARAVRLSARSPMEGGLSQASGGGRRRLRLHDGLLAAQIVVGIVLLAGSVGALRSWNIVRDFDRLGYRWEGVTLLRIEAPAGEAGDRAPAFAARIHEAAGDHPAIRRHALLRTFGVDARGGPGGTSPLRLDGEPGPVPPSRVPLLWSAVGPGYFDFREIPLGAGRGIEAGDRDAGVTAAVLSRAALVSLWPGLAPAQALGRGFVLSLGERRHSFTVVGVSEDYVERPSRAFDPPSPRIHVALLGLPPGLLGGDASAAVSLQAELAPGAPGVAGWSEWAGTVTGTGVVSHMTRLDTLLDDLVTPVRITGWVMTALAGFILLLLVVGIYGTVGYRVALSRREIGVRMALGAGAREVIWSTVRRVALTGGGALALGLLLSAVAGRLLDGGPVPIGEDNPLLLLVVSLVLCVAAAAAALPPALRALRTDPVDTLREG